MEYVGYLIAYLLGGLSYFFLLKKRAKAAPKKRPYVRKTPAQAKKPKPMANGLDADAKRAGDNRSHAIIE